MGEVSYKLMQTIILRNLKKELDGVAEKYKKMAADLDPKDPTYAEKLLKYSNEMFDEMNEIQSQTFRKYAKELEELNVP